MNVKVLPYMLVSVKCAVVVHYSMEMALSGLCFEVTNGKMTVNETDLFSFPFLRIFILFLCIACVLIVSLLCYFVMGLINKPHKKTPITTKLTRYNIRLNKN
jgi:hypothetical protein